MSAKHIHALVKAEKWPLAWHLTSEALNEAPDDPELLYLAGCIMRAQQSIGMSLAFFSKALARDQKQPNLWMHYGATLHDLHEWDDALAAFSKVTQMLPDDPMPYANSAASYSQMGRWRECIDTADKALSLDPENYIAHISKSFACFALGRWADGWKHGAHLYENHLAVRVYNSPENEEPEWDGSHGKTVVVQCDQGIGDILMFAQCLPQMAIDCKEVILECAERLVPLMKRNFPQLTIYGTLKQAGQSWSLNHKIDAHIHISAIGRWYRQKAADFPRVAYIKPDMARVEKWREWLQQFPRPWVGVSWKGGIHRTLAHLRSLELEQFAPILEQRGTFIDLSYTDNGAEVARWNINLGTQVIIPPIDQADYDDTAALLFALDEVATVTTAVVHACGSMGRTARVLVPESPMWRYAHRCEDGMIWYPPDSVKLYRRKPGERWASPIKRLANDIAPRIQLV
jgi:tetratricopeptide (TPR) repeat protein